MAISMTLAERQRRMARDYTERGSMRAEDVFAVLGDPSRGVSLGPALEKRALEARLRRAGLTKSQAKREASK